MGDNDPTEDERRHGVERRSKADDAKWAERRASQERRTDEDRRGIHYSVRYTTPEAVEKLREWLQEHCASAFEIQIPDDPVELRKWGKFRVRFDTKEDRTKLARLLGVHWPKWMG